MIRFYVNFFFFFLDFFCCWKSTIICINLHFFLEFLLNLKLIFKLHLLIISCIYWSFLSIKLRNQNYNITKEKISSILFLYFRFSFWTFSFLDYYFIVESQVNLFSLYALTKRNTLENLNISNVLYSESNKLKLKMP